jgi:hypothetical protein
VETGAHHQLDHRDGARWVKIECMCLSLSPPVR